MDSWNDERLDELSRRIDAGFSEAASRAELTAAKEEINRRFDEASQATRERFDQVDRKIDQSFEIARREFGRLNDRLDKLFWGIGFVGLTIGLNVLADKV